MKIEQHRLVGAPYQKSPNVSSGVIVPRFIVDHYTAGWNAASAIATLMNPKAQVSAHFVIDRDGTITQLVDCNRRAWHAGPSAYKGVKDLNSHSIGLEFVNPGWLKAGPGGTYSQGNTAIPAARLKGYDLSCVKPNPRLGSGNFVWPAYTAEQINAGLDLVDALVAAYPTIEDALTHEEIDTRGWKTDPGPAFPQSRFKLAVQQRRAVRK